jgi:prevent-host-death family protein
MLGAIILPISDLRSKTKSVLGQAKDKPVIITQRSRPQAVLVDYEQFNEMTERLKALEDARDALIIERARATASEFVTVQEALADYEQATGHAITVADLLEELGQDV